MNCSAQEIVDAIITVGVRRGSDGRGKDGLDGHMFMLARTDHESFGILLVEALRLKMKAKPEHWTAGKKFLTHEEAKAELRERAAYRRRSINHWPLLRPRQTAGRAMRRMPNQMAHAQVMEAVDQRRDTAWQRWPRQGWLGGLHACAGAHRTSKTFIMLMEHRAAMAGGDNKNK